MPGVLGCFQDAASLSKARERLRGLVLLVHGTVPEAAGLSSSSAMVVASVLAFAWATGLELTPTEAAQVSIKCER